MPNDAPQTTPEAAETAAEDLRGIKRILNALPATNARERQNQRDWSRALDLGAEALTEKAAILRAKKAMGHA